jgi:hypothetical protein
LTAYGTSWAGSTANLRVGDTEGSGNIGDFDPINHVEGAHSFGGVLTAQSTEIRAGGDIDQGLLDRGDPARGQLRVHVFDIEPGDVPFTKIICPAWLVKTGRCLGTATTATASPRGIAP